MEQYQLNLAKFGTHVLISEELGTGKKILDVGCNKGYLKKLATNCQFYGLDYTSEDLEEAKKSGYLYIEQIDLNNHLSIKLKDKFDIIVFGDILEHLLEPDKVLKFFIDNYLIENGVIIVSLPNIANFLIRLQLLLGNFEYTESGILDKTHLHFYTVASARKFANSAGLEILNEKFSSNMFGKVIKIFSFLSGLLAFNIILVCKKKYK